MTGEVMVLELVRVHSELTGSDTYTFHNRLWIREQLDELAGRGLLRWSFDEEANFKVELLADGKAVPVNGMAGCDEVVMLGFGR